jgi:hypothetical protein
MLKKKKKSKLSKTNKGGCHNKYLLSIKKLSSSKVSVASLESSALTNERILLTLKTMILSLRTCLQENPNYHLLSHGQTFDFPIYYWLQLNFLFFELVVGNVDH